MTQTSSATPASLMVTAADADRACGSCVLWTGRHDASALAAHCHRFPPQSPNGERLFPITSRADWCGGHIRAAEDTRGFAGIGAQP